MIKKNNYHVIKLIKDWKGNDWEVYEEKISNAGIVLYKGSLYLTGAKPFSYILTDELANYLKQHTIFNSVKNLGISKNKVVCFRRELDIQKKYFSLDYKWMNENKEELLNESYNSLNEKYGLKKSQVERYKYYLKNQSNLIYKENKYQNSQFARERVKKIAFGMMKNNFKVPEPETHQAGKD